MEKAYYYLNEIYLNKIHVHEIDESCLAGR